MRLYEGKCITAKCDQYEKKVDVWANDVKDRLIVKKVQERLEQVQCEACRGPLLKILSVPAIIIKNKREIWEMCTEEKIERGIPLNRI